MAFSFDIKGIEGLQKKLDQFPEKTKEAVRNVLIPAVTEINAEQVLLARRFEDRGGIVQGLDWEPAGELSYRLFSQAPHSAYIEFGTGKKFTPIPDVNAGQYRGGSGSSGGKGFFANILAWVIRKRIGATLTKSGNRSKSKDAQQKEKQVAYMIYRSILKNGIKPQPFFFVPFLSRRKGIVDDVEKAINNIK